MEGRSGEWKSLLREHKRDRLNKSFLYRKNCQVGLGALRCRIGDQDVLV